MDSVEVIDVVIGLVMVDNQILVTKRRKDTHLGGFWEFPGGKPEPGEDHAAALIRELKEETDLDIQVGALFHETVHAYPEKTVRLSFYKAWPVGDPHSARPLQVDALEWAPLPHLSTFRFPPANQVVLEKLSDA